MFNGKEETFFSSAVIRSLIETIGSVASIQGLGCHDSPPTCLQFTVGEFLTNFIMAVARTLS